MGFSVFKVDRTSIVARGEIPKDLVTNLFDKVCQERMATMVYDYNPETDVTELRFYPCKRVTVEATIKRAGQEVISREHKLVMTGVIPQFVDFVEEYWVPMRKRAKKANENLRWVVMYPPRRVIYEDDNSPVGTEIGFSVDFRCDEDQVDATLIEACRAVGEKLRLIASNANPALMRSARLLDEISMYIAEQLNATEDEARFAKIRSMGLRTFDTDDLCFSDENLQRVSSR